MSTRFRLRAGLGVLLLSVLPTVSLAQPRINIPAVIPNPATNNLRVLAQQTGILGQAIGNYYRQIPPYAFYNPYNRFGAPGIGPIGPVGPIAPVAPLGLGAGAYSPLAAGAYGAALSTAPLGGASLATTGVGYGGYDGFLGAYTPFYDPFSGYLRGAADVTMANARYQTEIQDARLKREESRRAQLETRRALLEQYEWEYRRRPSAEKWRLETMEQDLARARRSPPKAEIWSGKSLNDLLRHLTERKAKGASAGQTVPLNEDVLRHINVTAGVGGNAGLLKDGGALTWPLPLQGKAFEDLREKMNKGLPEAVNLLKFNNPVDKGSIDDMTKALREAHKTLDQQIADLLPSEFVEALRFLNQLDGAMRVLRDRNASNYFTQKWVAKGKNVDELITHMIEHGLQFAPAVSGDEHAYTALHFALVRYDSSLPTDNSTPRDPTP